MRGAASPVSSRPLTVMVTGTTSVDTALLPASGGCFERALQNSGQQQPPIAGRESSVAFDLERFDRRARGVLNRGAFKVLAGQRGLGIADADRETLPTADGGLHRAHAAGVVE